MKIKSSELTGTALDWAVSPPAYLALRVPCPVCKRQIGDVCKDPRGNARWGKPHKTRVNLSKEKANEERDCESHF